MYPDIATLTQKQARLIMTGEETLSCSVCNVVDEMHLHTLHRRPLLKRY